MDAQSRTDAILYSLINVCVVVTLRKVIDGGVGTSSKGGSRLASLDCRLRSATRQPKGRLLVLPPLGRMEALAAGWTTKVIYCPSVSNGGWIEPPCPEILLHLSECQMLGVGGQGGQQRGGGLLLVGLPGNIWVATVMWLEQDAALGRPSLV